MTPPDGRAAIVSVRPHGALSAWGFGIIGDAADVQIAYPTSPNKSSLKAPGHGNWRDAGAPMDVRAPGPRIAPADRGIK